MSIIDDINDSMQQRFMVIAFSDNVGSVCSEECGEAACRDINADHEEADAGLDPYTGPPPTFHCMGCGKVVS